MKYLATFIGCRLGAIGITYPCRVEVEADTPELARLELFNTHEHVSRLTLTAQELTRSVPGGVGIGGMQKLTDALKRRCGFATRTGTMGND
jgi:hypothetical protein